MQTFGESAGSSGAVKSWMGLEAGIVLADATGADETTENPVLAAVG